MALLVSDVGEARLLDMMLKDTADSSTTLRLYTNDYTPVEGSEDTDFTEAVGVGYSAAVLARASWTIATVTGTTTASYAEQTFALTGTIEVFGYYVTATTGGVLLWAERFASSASLGAGGGDIKITPKIQLD